MEQRYAWCDTAIIYTNIDVVDGHGCDTWWHSYVVLPTPKYLKNDPGRMCSDYMLDGMSGWLP